MRKEWNKYHFLLMKTLSCSNIWLIFSGFPLKSSVVSITSTLLESYSLNQFSCLVWIIYRYSKGISSSSCLFLTFVLSWHLVGQHLKQMTFVLSIAVMASKLLQRDLKTSYSASSMYPRSFMSWEKTYLSARMLLSDIFILEGYLSQASWRALILVKRAQIWKVNPHLFGYLQYLSKILMFFPPKFCHSFTGSSIHLASGSRSLKSSRNVDFPHPMFPSIVKQNSVDSSGFRRYSSTLSATICSLSSATICSLSN